MVVLSTKCRRHWSKMKLLTVCFVTAARPLGSVPVNCINHQDIKVTVTAVSVRTPAQFHKQQTSNRDHEEN
jgi:hypothetical protein